MKPESHRPALRTLGVTRESRASFPAMGRGLVRKIDWARRRDGVIVASRNGGIPTPINLLDRVFRSGSARDAE